MEVVPAMQLLLGQPTEPFRGAAIRVAGRAFPLMIVDYIGTVNTYLSLPFFALWGVRLFSLRLMAILLGACTLLLTYLVAESLFDRLVAALACLLLAVHPSFIFWSRQGVFVTSALTIFTTGSLLAFLRWHRSGRFCYLYLGAFLLGVGLFTKFSFLWFILGLLGAGALMRFWPRARHHFLPQATLVPGATAILAFALGASPLILYNLQTGGTIKVILGNLSTSYYGVSNLALGRNLLIRGQQFIVLLKGGQFWYLGGVFSDELYPPLFLMVTLSAMILAFCREREWLKKLAFLATLLVVMILLSAFTVSDLWITHYVILLPWPQVLLAASLGLWAHQLSGRLKIAPLLVALTLLFSNLWVDGAYHRALTRSGGYSHHSDAIYQLADYLEEREGPVIAMDWGIRNNVLFLTQGRVDPQELFGFDWEADPGFRERLTSYLSDPRTLYLFHSPEETVFERRQAFESLVRERGLEVRGEKVFLDRSGKQIFVILRVVPKG
jgi:hypothetical protein